MIVQKTLVNFVLTNTIYPTRAGRITRAGFKTPLSLTNFFFILAPLPTPTLDVGRLDTWKLKYS